MGSGVSRARLEGGSMHGPVANAPSGVGYAWVGIRSVQAESRWWGEQTTLVVTRWASSSRGAWVRGMGGHAIIKRLIVIGGAYEGAFECLELL